MAYMATGGSRFGLELGDVLSDEQEALVIKGKPFVTRYAHSVMEITDEQLTRLEEAIAAAVDEHGDTPQVRQRARQAMAREIMATADGETTDGDGNG